MAKTGLGLRQFPPSTSQYWSFRLLNAEILLGQRETSAAVEALKFDLPPVASTARFQIRYRIAHGFAAYLKGDYPAAHLHLDSGADLARSAGAADLLGETELRQCLLAVAEKRIPDAEALSRKLLSYAEQNHVPWLAVSATGNLGFIRLRDSRFDEAIPYFERAVLSAEKLGLVESYARNEGNLGWCNYRLGDYDKALHQFEDAVERLRPTGNRYLTHRWFGNIGSIYLGRREYAAAARNYSGALAVARDLHDNANAAQWLTNLASIAIETRRADDAARYNDEGLALKRKLGDATSLAYSVLNAGRIEALRGHFEEAITLFRQVLHSPADPPTLLDAHKELALALGAARRYDAANAEFRAALGAIDSVVTANFSSQQRLSWFSSANGFYEDYIRALMQRGRVEEALEVADASRARTMSAKLSLGRPVARHAADFRSAAQRSRSTLLSYSVGANQSWLWIVTPGAISSVQLPPEPELRQLVSAWQKSVDELQDPLAKESPTGRQLYQTLIAPAEAAILKTGRVILVPDGALYSVNFETLPVFGAAKPHYLIEDALISIAPSLGLLNPLINPLVNPHQAAPPASRILLTGNPVSPDPDFPNLRFAAREMDFIRKAIPSTVLTGAAATPAAWAAAHPERFSLIHFTAHARANREEPLESAVILSREPGKPAADYRLKAREVVRTPLNASLVTLSACRSAGVRIYAGEGLVGLAWAFLEAGAHNVIAGLWDVNDESSPKLMARLYEGVAKGESPAEALRSAKLDMLHVGGVWRKPWYWGAFQLFTTELALI